MDIGQLIKRSISDSRSVEDILDKRLRNEVQPTETNGVGRLMRLWTSICIASSATWKA